MSNSENILAKASSQLGIKEGKNNSGKEVVMYLNSVGLDAGNPWCMAFVYWCVKEALGPANPLVKTGGVLAQWDKISASRKVSTPKMGDIFIMNHGGGKGHTGFVATVDIKKKKFTTVEGNSDSKLSRTGGMVCSNTRSFASCIGFIRVA